jgi:hypothetical protein
MIFARVSTSYVHLIAPTVLQAEGLTYHVVPGMSQHCMHSTAGAEFTDKLRSIEPCLMITNGKLATN